MNKKRIEEIRKSLNIDDGLQFGFAEDLVLWIIGGFGPVDMQPDGIKFEYVPLSDFPNGINDLKKIGYIDPEHSKVNGEWQLLK